MKEETTIISFNHPSAVELLTSTPEKNRKQRSYGLFIFILVFIVIEFGLIIPGMLSKNVQKTLSAWSGPRLVGKQDKIRPRTPAFSLRNAAAGNWQKQFELWFNQHIPFRNFIIRALNQVYFNLLATSHANGGSIVVGKKGYLFQEGYINQYYNTSRSIYTQESFDEWATDLQSLANFFHRRGQHFIYFITPSKATYFSEYLPTCRSCNKNETRPKYHLAVNTLKKRGFKFIDGSQILLDRKKTLNDKLFPKSGIHWTKLGAAYATRELMNSIFESSTGQFPKLMFSYKMKPIEAGCQDSDSDLLCLANLLKPPLDYNVPKVSISPLPQKGKNPLKIAFVGGSFSTLPAKILSTTHLFKQIDIFTYLIISHKRPVPGVDKFKGSLIHLPMKSNEPNVYHPEDYQDLFNADVVILEENEEVLRSNHFKLLLKRTVGKVANY